MQGNQNVISFLNQALVFENESHDEYLIVRHLYESMGFKKIGKFFGDLHKDESSHAKELIDRIYFLEGVPEMNTPRTINQTPDIKDQLTYNLKKENEMVLKYREGIKICDDASDYDTQELLLDLLEDETEHVDELEKELNRLKQMGEDNYYQEGK